MNEKLGFNIDAVHNGIRFHLASQRDTMRLLFFMVRDSKVTVDEAMACIKFDDQQSDPARCSHGNLAEGPDRCTHPDHL